mmetsp:Transcript_9685/g.23699  ORF Transcript_9685/g.23699 Transcript_9685/m.23699 type:complete len:556 (+) Transcript_9685:151-1818(+)
MRQRKTNIFSPDIGASLSRHSNSDDDSNSSLSDHEDSILPAHPDEEAGARDFIEATSRGSVWDRRRRMFMDDLKTNQTKWAQCVTIATAALATYSFHNIGTSANVQVAIMIVITLVGATPFCKSHLTTTAIGTFVGGHNIIGATKGLAAAPEVGDQILTSYLWLLVLSLGVGSVWCWFVTHPRIQLLDGYAGRLGTTTFIGMNLVMVFLLGPLGVVSWNRYYYGFVDIVHVAEEDSVAISLASVWSWTEEFELAIGYILAVLWLGIISGATRLKHHQNLLEWDNKHRGEEDPGEAPTPLNNVLVPVLWTLASILAINATGYKHAAGLYNGFAVGAYVGMASLQKIPSITKFATISLVAGLWGLALTPFFVGFAGKSGFTSMMGHITHVGIEKYLWEKFRNRLHWKQRLQDQREVKEEEEKKLRQEEEEQEKIRWERQQEEEKQRLLQEQQIREAEERQNAFKSSEPYHPPNKPSRKKELVFTTKQQRRQQQRLRQQQQKQQEVPFDKIQGRGDANAVPLRHRAWVAAPADGDGVWEHPQLQEASALSQVSKANMV